MDIFDRLTAAAGRFVPVSADDLVDIDGSGGPWKLETPFGQFPDGIGNPDWYPVGPNGPDDWTTAVSVSDTGWTLVTRIPADSTDEFTFVAAVPPAERI